MSCASSRRSASKLLATGILGLTSLGVPAAQHAFGAFNIHVAADSSDVTTSTDYQITVENDELLLTRLTAAHAGTLSNSFVTDLNKDGAFEVIVTFSFADGHDTEVHLYSWNDYRLQPHKVAALDATQRTGYQGNHEFAVANGEFVRIYQIYEMSNGEWQPTAQQRRLRYSFDETRWLSD